MATSLRARSGRSSVCAKKNHSAEAMLFSAFHAGVGPDCPTLLGLDRTLLADVVAVVPRRSSLPRDFLAIDRHDCPSVARRARSRRGAKDTSRTNLVLCANARARRSSMLRRPEGHHSCSFAPNSGSDVYNRPKRLSRRTTFWPGAGAHGQSEGSSSSEPPAASPRARRRS